MISARVCRYGERDGSGPLVRLSAKVLSGGTALEFQGAIGSLKTAKPIGVYACPAAFRSVTLLAFGYAARPTVDLWYNDTGCQTLDNGYVKAWSVVNFVAFAHFAELVSSFAREPAGS